MTQPPLDAFATLAQQISVMKCWLCSTPIGEKDDTDEEPIRGVFPLCEDCQGKELIPRAHVWRLMQGLQSTQNHTGRERAKSVATIRGLEAENARLRAVLEEAQWIGDDYPMLSAQIRAALDALPGVPEETT